MHDAVRRRSCPPGDGLPGDDAEADGGDRPRRPRPAAPTPRSPPATDPFGGELAGVLDVSRSAACRPPTTTLGRAIRATRPAPTASSPPSARRSTPCSSQHPTSPRRARRQRRPDPVRPRARRHRLLQRARVRREVGDVQSPLTAALVARLPAHRRPLRRRPPAARSARVSCSCPTIAVGRLVETPAEIVTALDNYVDVRRPPRPVDGAVDRLRLPGRRRRARSPTRSTANGADDRDADRRHVDGADDLDAAPRRGPPDSPRSTPTSTTSGPCRPIRTAPDRRTTCTRLGRRLRRAPVPTARRRAAVLDGLPRRPVGQRRHRVRAAHSRTGRRRSPAKAPCSPATPGTATATTPSSAPPRTSCGASPTGSTARCTHRPGDGPGQAAVPGRDRGSHPVRREGRRRRSSSTACRSSGSATAPHRRRRSRPEPDRSMPDDRGSPDVPVDGQPERRRAGRPADASTSDRGQYYASFDGDTQPTADQPVQPRAVVDLTQRRPPSCAACC